MVLSALRSIEKRCIETRGARVRRSQAKAAACKQSTRKLTRLVSSATARFASRASCEILLELSVPSVRATMYLTRRNQQTDGESEKDKQKLRWRCTQSSR
jgi:hypothetical protein